MGKAENGSGSYCTGVLGGDKELLGRIPMAKNIWKRIDGMDRKKEVMFPFQQEPLDLKGGSRELSVILWLLKIEELP